MMMFDGMMDDTCLHFREVGKPCDGCVGGVALPKAPQWSEEHLRKMAAAEDEAGSVNIGSADQQWQVLRAERGLGRYSVVVADSAGNHLPQTEEQALMMAEAPKMEAQIQTASDVFRSIALLVDHPMPEEGRIDLRDLYMSVAWTLAELGMKLEKMRLYVAYIDEVPDLTTKPHEICAEVSAETVTKMWAVLKTTITKLQGDFDKSDQNNDELRDHCTRLQKELTESDQENDTLRSLLAKGRGPCVYCQLPAEDIAKCPHGFPGCGRMDDLAAEINSAVESRLEKLNLDLMEERDVLKDALSVRQSAGGPRPSIDEIIEKRKVPHVFVPLPEWMKTDRTDDPCLLCINAKDDPIHDDDTNNNDVI